jgi:hypothetical protein
VTIHDAIVAVILVLVNDLRDAYLPVYLPMVQRARKIVAIRQAYRLDRPSTSDVIHPVLSPDKYVI